MERGQVILGGKLTGADLSVFIAAAYAQTLQAAHDRRSNVDITPSVRTSGRRR